MDFTLELNREDAAFLSGVYSWLAINPDPTLDEDQLRNIYGIVSEVAHGDPSSTAQRATSAIARLREQRLMVRTDTVGIIRGGEYSLSRMGNAIAEWFGEQEGLTRQSLEVMMTRIRADLGQIKLAAAEGGNRGSWEARVSGPLRERIGAMLEESWFDSVRSCEELLGATSEALQELHRVLMHEIEGMLSLLNEIEDLCEKNGEEESVEAVAHVRRQVARVGAWGESRFAAWSEYYQSVHEFIRSVISVDPERAIRTRLRDALREYGLPVRWFLTVADQPPYRHLRGRSDDRAPQQVESRRRPPDEALEHAGIAQSRLEKIVGEILARMRRDGQVELMEVLRELLPEHGADELYVLAGELAEWLLRRGTPLPFDASTWHPLGKGIEIQNLTVRRRDA
jgi:chromosome partition protein MukF